ncbi:unnamed protein product [Calicophoron daubneyi]|uniref:Dol-P-Glc:Glc(2)Man(9)GlcNAc(2)-PP-Dol alpha-1,2-glucosyltransferase n=1 Tax=Calicophoron daubneyi TaxID=300641 RepID=A0AAV2U227_CALDB
MAVHLTPLDLFWSVLLVSFSSLISILISNVQPAPYMDEIFHARQTHAYLAGNWSQWDQKLTTPPGTYLVFIAIYKLLAFFLGSSDLPAMVHLRCFTSVFSGINYLLITTILRTTGRGSSNLMSLSIVTNPVLIFFSSLYYTDQCSLTFVLATVYLSLLRCPKMSAFMCACAITVRQTNVVWLLLSFSLLAGGELSILLFGFNGHFRFRAWIIILWRMCTMRPALTVSALRRILAGLFSHVLVALLFGAFLCWNGGIVLGDRTAHEASVHIPQLFYFATFCSLFTPVEYLFYCQLLFSSLKRTKRAPYKLLLYLSLATGLVGLIVFSLRFFSYTHPYLLADNRHYTFYLWRRLLHRSQFQSYLLAPVYLICLLFVGNAIWGHFLPMTLTDFLVNISFCLCTCFCLIPAKLLEPRYFITPYVIWRLRVSSRKANYRSLLVELSINCIVHALTVYVFVFRPFIWPQEPDTLQRFMW